MWGRGRGETGRGRGETEMEITCWTMLLLYIWTAGSVTEILIDPPPSKISKMDCLLL